MPVVFRGRSARQAVLACSLAALAAACSQGSSPPRPMASVASPSGASGDNYDYKYGVSSSPRVGDLRKGGGTYKLGVPYRIGGRWYVPREEPGYDRQGIGSWYGDDFQGRKTANGEIFDMHALTAAHPTLPMPSYAYVTNITNGRTILVRINDRGPYANDRVIDLSHASARALGYENKGTQQVRVKYAGRAPLNGDDRRERQYLASQPWSRGNGPAVAAYVPPNATLNPPEPFPAGTAGRWSPANYRAALAGKPVPQTSALHMPVARPPYRSAAATPSIQPTAYGQRASLGGAPVISTGSVTSRTYVQVGLFRDRNTAERLKLDLSALGLVEVATLLQGRDETYRVRIGPMSDANAHATLAQVSAHGVAGSTVVRE